MEQWELCILGVKISSGHWTVSNGQPQFFGYRGGVAVGGGIMYCRSYDFSITVKGHYMFLAVGSPKLGECESLQKIIWNCHVLGTGAARCICQH